VRIDHNHRAGMIWPILTELAKSQDLITYGRLAQRIGIHHRPIRYALSPIQDFCLEQDLPRLTALVVTASTGVLGSGFAGSPGDEADLTEVRSFDWAQMRNPFLGLSESELKRIGAKLAEDPQSSNELYVLTRSRGDQQRVFREALMLAYDRQCAVCRTSFSEVLEAAHIDPWCSAAKHRRIDPRNGILLCANHHKLFDSSWLLIDENFIITSWDPSEIEGPYAESDTRILTAFHGRKLALPSQQKSWPDRKLLKTRYAEAVS
jgi:putative restriction endonuclease